MDITKAACALAAKAFVINDRGELLIIKRRPNDVHSPDVWEVPGGRLEVGEDPIEGVQRETREEVSIEIDVQEPLGVRSFTRDDGQHITMMVFRAKPCTTGIVLSEEHTAFEWVPMDKAREMLHKAFGAQCDTWERYYKDR